MTLEEALQEVGPGWAPLVREAYEHLPEDVRVIQVKEKLAGLRIYTTDAPEEYDRILNAIMRRSYDTCELCGAPGSSPRSTVRGWLKTLCAKHAPNYATER